LKAQHLLLHFLLDFLVTKVYNYSIDAAMMLVSNIEERITMTNIDINEVQALFNHYHAKKVASPNLYVAANNVQVNVVLPKNLLEYANAAAGHSGFGAGARAVGIRKSCADAKSTIADIFATQDSLVDFLNSSERNAEVYVAGIRAKHLGMSNKKSKYRTVKTDDRPADSNFAVLSQNHDMISLQKRFGRDTCIQSRKTLTINEFELRFGLTA